jgi:membrane-associated phospholipid phosphatase
MSDSGIESAGRVLGGNRDQETMLICICGGGFGLLTILAAAGGYLPGEKALLAAIVAHRWPPLNLPAQWISALGSANVILPLWVVIVSVLVFRKQIGSALTLLPAPLGYPIYALIKSVIARPGTTPAEYHWIYDLPFGYHIEGLLRQQVQQLPPQGVVVPVVTQPVTTQAVEQAMERGYVSGHALVALIFYGALAWCLWRYARPGWARTAAIGICTAMAFLVGVVRIYMGLHFPSDVLGAWLLGVVLLVLTHWIVQSAMPYIEIWGKQFALWRIAPR